jgi:two-component system, NtrC family, response regulator PilR
MSIQGKLLRVLQEKEVRRVGSNDNVSIDARVIAATNTRLETLLKDGMFREDLYYRLSVIPIEIRPLRERTEDILPLVYHVLKQETPAGAQTSSISPEVASILESYNWPGNVRELENAIRHAMTFARDTTITPEVLPPKLRQAFQKTITPAGTPGAGTAESIDPQRCKSLKTFLRTKEKEYLQQILNYTGGDKEKAAKALDISLATLYRKLPDDEDSTPRSEA